MSVSGFKVSVVRLREVSVLKRRLIEVTVKRELTVHIHMYCSEVFTGVVTIRNFLGSLIFAIMLLDLNQSLSNLVKLLMFGCSFRWRAHFPIQQILTIGVQPPARLENGQLLSPRNSYNSECIVLTGLHYDLWRKKLTHNPLYNCWIQKIHRLLLGSLSDPSFRALFAFVCFPCLGRL